MLLSTRGVFGLLLCPEPTACSILPSGGSRALDALPRLEVEYYNNVTLRMRNVHDHSWSPLCSTSTLHVPNLHRLVKVGRNSEIQSEVSVPERCWQATFVNVFTKRALTLAGLHKLDIRYLAAHSPNFRPRIRAEGTRDTFHPRDHLDNYSLRQNPFEVILESLSPVGHQSNA